MSDCIILEAIFLLVFPQYSRGPANMMWMRKKRHVYNLSELLKLVQAQWIDQAEYWCKIWIQIYVLKEFEKVHFKEVVQVSSEYLMFCSPYYPTSLSSIWVSYPVFRIDKHWHKIECILEVSLWSCQAFLCVTCWRRTDI